MKVGVLGTGVVGQTLGTKLVEVGHEVRMGSRTAGNEKAVAWAAAAGASASEGTFAEAASYADLIFNATAGTAAMEALAAAGGANLAGKVVIDLSNPLDFSRGFPPSLATEGGESVAEQIQATYPEARVVKSLNTMSCDVMVDPSIVPGEHSVFVAGNEEGAKAEVRAVLESFGWPSASIIDLGDVTAARGLEMYVILWLRLFVGGGTGHFNIHVKVAKH